jgi:site-specific DNA recombinase
VSRDVWERAQLQRKVNFTESTRNLKRNYLLRSRVRCGHCNASVNCYATVNNGNEAKAYFYYRCNGVMGNIANVTCTLPSFRVDIVDKLVWDWIKLLLTDDSVLENGLKLYTENQEELLAPLRDRMAVLDDLLRDTKSQLDRVIDLYVAGDIPRDILVDKKQRLETTLSALSEERQQLLAHMQGKALNEKDLQKIRNFAAQVADGLDLDELDFEGRRRLVEMLDVHAKFFIEDDQKVVEIWCILGTGELPVMNNSDHQMGSNSLPFMNPSFRSAARARGCRCCSGRSRRRPHRTCRRASWR